MLTTLNMDLIILLLMTQIFMFLSPRTQNPSPNDIIPKQ
jgi:hypothetical protein